MAKAYIFGAGGHARVIASFLDVEPVFLVPGEPVGPDQMRQSAFFDISAVDPGTRVYIGIGSNEARIRIFEQLKQAGISTATCIAPTAWIAKDATIEPGAVICAGAVIGSRARIGANTIVNTMSSVDHDCIVGDHTQVTAGVTLAGGVKVGRNCFFGIKSGVVPGITIGDNVSVMAGSVVVKDAEGSVLLGGVPAKVMRTL